MATTTIILLTVLAVETALLVLMTVLYRKAKKASKQRRVEAPNSEYKSPYVQDLEAKERWERVELSRLHEVNREEFERLLNKVRGTSVRALSPNERAFLDRMAEAYERGARPGGGAGKGGTRRTRHLPGTP